jgi:serine kinase of HPr protein (carbohydrate metabolism regulator)
MSDTIHTSSVAIGGRGVLIAGAPGRGKSDLSLRLIDRGATLISDDYTNVEARDGRLWASPPPTIAGKIEVRGLGILAIDHAAEPVPVALFVDLDAVPERLPAARATMILGIALPVVALAALEASAPLKAEAALDLFGLPYP